jgi:hypothetical protein
LFEPDCHKLSVIPAQAGTHASFRK